MAESRRSSAAVDGLAAAAEDRGPSYRIHLELYDNSGPIEASSPRSPSGSSAPPLSALPSDWRETLAELRQSGTYLVPSSASGAGAGPPLSLFGRLPHVPRKKRRDRGKQLSDLPPPRARRASAADGLLGGGTKEPPIDQRFGPIAIHWADHISAAEGLAEDLGNMSLNASANGRPAAASVPLEQQASQASTSSAASGSAGASTSTSAQPAARSGPGNAAAPAPITPARPRAPSTKRAGTPLTPTAAHPETPTPVARFQHKSTFAAGDAPAAGSSAGGARVGSFVTGATDVAFGVVHLFRDREEAALESRRQRDVGAPTDRTGGEAAAGSAAREAEATLSEDELGTVLAVLAVPSSMTAADFLAFVEPAQDAISHLRMIRETLPNRAMILLKFRDASDAEEFHKLFNGQPFNAMHPDQICQVVYVTSVAVSSSSALPSHSFPHLTGPDPWPLGRARSSSVTSTADALAKGLLQELPTCPVCLERMDAAVTGLMTITCQHTFHCACLSKWTDSRCPVCRYSQTRQAYGHVVARRPGAHDEEEDETSAPQPSSCAECHTTTDLWVCLICASVGCGRYKAGHAHQHYKETGHLYSLELETQRVWDYAGDGYVHRLIQNKADGKLVELPSASSTGNTPSGKGGAYANGSGDMVSSDKIESIGLEYSYLLTSQLESQRFFYEDKIHGLQKKLDDLVQRDAQYAARAAEADAELAKLREELRRAAQAAKELEADKARADKRAEKAVELARKLQRDVQAEQSVSAGLQARIETMKERAASTETRVTDLEEQMRDLMFFVSAREKVEAAGGELAGADVEVAPAASAKGKKKSKK